MYEDAYGSKRHVATPLLRHRAMDWGPVTTISRWSVGKTAPSMKRRIVRGRGSSDLAVALLYLPGAYAIVDFRRWWWRMGLGSGVGVLWHGRLALTGTNERERIIPGFMTPELRRLYSFQPVTLEIRKRIYSRNNRAGIVTTMSR